MIIDSSSEDLARVLHGLRLTESCYCRTELTAPWGLEVSQQPNVVFHFVANGECWLERSGERRRLGVGDLVIFTRGSAHRLLGAARVPAASVLRLPPTSAQHRPATYISHGGGGARTLVLCGGAAFDPPDHTLAGLLPELLTLSENGGWVASAIAQIEREANERRPGGETVIARLCDVLLIHAIRAWLADSPDAQQGWLGALRDPHLGRALALIESDPGQPFTVASLAEEAHLSRAAFAERFARMVGVAPMEYVRRRRMRTATELLRRRDLPLAEVARRVGYGSAAAFSRAFKQSMGVAPGASRRRGPSPSARDGRR